MGLQEIGYGGQPLPTVLRPVHPALPVLIDLTVLFAREPHCNGRYHPNGLQMDSVVEGLLTYWALGEHGGWWGLVSYPVRHGTEDQTVTHWAPAWVLKRPHSDGQEATSVLLPMRRWAVSSSWSTDDREGNISS